MTNHILYVLTSNLAFIPGHSGSATVVDSVVDLPYNVAQKSGFLAMFVYL